jgi:hypothetical protein
MVEPLGQVMVDRVVMEGLGLAEEIEKMEIEKMVLQQVPKELGLLAGKQ